MWLGLVHGLAAEEGWSSGFRGSARVGWPTAGLN